MQRTIIAACAASAKESGFGFCRLRMWEGVKCLDKKYTLVTCLKDTTVQHFEYRKSEKKAEIMSGSGSGCVESSTRNCG